MAKRPQRPRKSTEKSNRSLFRRTVFLMVTLGVVMFIPLVAQLWKLQITQHDYWQERAANQQTKDVAVNANRGAIYDRNGETLAMSATVYNLILSPRDVLASVNKDRYKDEDGNLRQGEYDAAVLARRTLIVEGLAELLDLDEERLWRRIEYTASAYEQVAFDLEDEDANAVRQFIADNHLSSMLYLTPTSKRYYPHASVGSHVLGYMAENEYSGGVKIGVQGIEMLYQDMLSGAAGRVITSQNAYGTQMLSSYEQYFDAQNGYNLNLTLDANIQAKVEQTLAEGIATYDVQQGGFCIVMDPSTGAILAMASTPDFDPNSYDSILSQDLLDDIHQAEATYGKDSDEYRQAVKTAYGAQWRNKALSDTYEPGSVFKPITVAMGLEEGLISPNDHYFCSGGKVVAGRNIPCHKRGGHQDQDVTHTLMNSCNVALMEMAEEIGPEIMWKYFKDFGLFDETGIDLAGEGTSIFWTGGLDFFAGPYGVQSVATSSFGQTFKVTPIQMITAFAAVINGGHLLEPYVVQSVTDDNGATVYYHETTEVRQVISETTSATVREMLEHVVGSNGSGRNAYMTGYRIGGKTGTSQKVELWAIDPDNDDVICSFMGFAPADNPRVLVLLAYDTPKRATPGSDWTASGTYISGGNIAAPMAGSLIADILDYMGIERQYSAQELAGADTVMPQVTGYELTVGKGLLSDRGIHCRTVGTGNRITGQIPAAGVSIPGGSEVILYLGEEVPTDLVEVPDLAGLTPAEAKSQLEALGLFLRTAGVSDYTDSSVKASSQTISPGTLVSPGTVVDVRFVSSVIDYGSQQG